MPSEPRLHPHATVCVWIGVSGWTYDSWRGGAFYPDDLPKSRELEYVTRRVGSLEINGSFYSLLAPPKRKSRDVYIDFPTTRIAES